ncbi:MAG: hypothetical protein V1793_11180 [Pseudomonadota bacterium]
MTSSSKPTEKNKPNEIGPAKENSKSKEKRPDFLNLPDDMPQEVKRTIQMAMMSSSSMGGPRHHPLFEKFTEEHVHKYLDYIQKDDDNEFSLRSSNRWFYLFYTTLGVCFFLFLVIYLLPNNKVFLDEILKLFVTFAGGLGSGYGLKVLKDKKK